MSEADEKIEKLKELTDKLDELAFEVLRQKVNRAFGGLLTYAIEPILVVSPKSRILDLNNLAKKLFKHQEDDRLIKTDVHTLIPDLPNLRLTRTSEVEQVSGLTADHSTIPLRLTIIPVVLETEFINCVVCTELKD